MPLSAKARRFGPLAATLIAGLMLAGCTNSMGLVSTRTQGYSIPDDALAQIRPGQSKELVTVVLGSPMTTNSFGEEHAFYYVETKVNQTEFGLTTVAERKVLAVYFDNRDRVVDKALYGLEDGRVFAIEQRRTPSFGQDRTFVESLINSL